MWTFNDKTGALTDSTGAAFAQGYSGHGVGVNAPDYQSVKDVGPIPIGVWNIGKPYNSAHCGQFAIPLTPQKGTQTFGRSGFFIHGDDIAHPGQELASLGCIVLPLPARMRIIYSGDTELNVISGENQ